MASGQAASLRGGDCTWELKCHRLIAGEPVWVSLTFMLVSAPYICSTGARGAGERNRSAGLSRAEEMRRRTSSENGKERAVRKAPCCSPDTGAWPLNVAILVHVGIEEQSRRFFGLSSPSSRRFVVSGEKRERKTIRS